MQRDVQPSKVFPFWLRCTECKKVVPNYGKHWPIKHDIDGGVWTIHWMSFEELLKPEYRGSVVSCSAC